MRNRLIAALSDLTIVVEGTNRSGSLYTADFAAQLGRTVAAVPGAVDSPMSEAPNALLFDGAQMVRGTQDVLDLLFGVGELEVSQVPDVSVPENLDAIWRLVCEGVATPAAICERLTSKGLPEVLAQLGELELEGLIARDHAGRYYRRPR